MTISTSIDHRYESGPASKQATDISTEELTCTVRAASPSSSLKLNETVPCNLSSGEQILRRLSWVLQGVRPKKILFQEMELTTGDESAAQEWAHRTSDVSDVVQWCPPPPCRSGLEEGGLQQYTDVRGVCFPRHHDNWARLSCRGLKKNQNAPMDLLRC